MIPTFDQNINNSNSELHLAASGRFHLRWDPGSGTISVNETLWEGMTEEPGSP